MVTERRRDVDPPRLALSVAEAAAALGVSETHFRRYVLEHVRSMQIGRQRVVPVVELERWLYLHAHFADELGE